MIPTRKVRLVVSALVLSALALAFASGYGNAIVIRHDRSDAQYRVHASTFPFFVHVMGQVGGTLVAPRWVLTAAHSVENVDPLSDWRVFIGGKRYDVDKIILHPSRKSGDVNAEYDIALLRLAQPVQGITPASLYRRSDEMDRQAIIIGRGRTGVGSLGSQINTRDGYMRRAEVTVQGVFGSVLLTVFRTPPNGNNLEGDGDAGDSGGPLLIRDANVWTVAGVGSTSSHTGIEGSHYDTLSAYARVSAFAAWIDETIARDPPSSLEQWPVLTTSTAMPPTNAGRLADAFLAAGNTQDYETIARFMREHGEMGRSPEEGAKEWLARFRKSGKQTLYGFTTLGDDRITVVVHAAQGEWIAYLLQTAKAHPDHLDMLVSGEVRGPPFRHDRDEVAKD